MNRRHIPRPRTYKPPVRPDDTSYKPFYVRTEAPVELVREIDRYFHTIKPDPLCKLEQLGRKEAEALLRNPIAFRVIVNTHFREHADELEGTRQLLPLETPVGAVELTDSAKDPKMIWAIHAEKIAEAKRIARSKIEELDRRTADIRDSSEKLSELETALADVTCADSSEIERLIVQLSGILGETRKVASVNIEQTLEPIEGGKIDSRDKDRLTVEAKEAVDAVVGEINSSIEQFNNALTESIRFLKCRISILKQFVKTFHTNWRWIRSLALIFSKDFPNFAADARANADELSKRIEEQERELQQKRKAYLVSEAVRSLYAANRARIVSVNDCIEEVNKAVVAVNRLAVEIGGYAEKVPEADLPGCASVDGDGLDALIKLIGQSKSVRNFYLVRFRTARRILEKIERDIEQIRDKYQSVVDACETTERTIGLESSEMRPVGNGERVELQIDAVLASVQDGRSGLARLVAKRMVCPENLDVLSRLLEPHTSSGRLALGLTEYAVLDRDIAQQDEEEVLRRLKQLRKNPAYLFLLENRTEILERAIYGEITEDTLKAIVSIYLARRSGITALERELYGNAVADLLNNDRETALIRGSRIPREELVRMYMPVLGSFYRSLSVLVDNGQYLSDHAAKHAGYRTERQIEAVQEEVELWERLRNGNGPLSLTGLGIKAGGEQIRAHYAQVSRTNAIFGAPFLAGFGYEEVRPIVFFIRDLAEDGLERHIMYTSFGLDSGKARWNTTFITTPDKLKYRAKLSLITPIPSMSIG